VEDDRQQQIRNIAQAENVVAQEDAERAGLAPHSREKPEGEAAQKA
jgi:hypothetical protein